MLVAQLVENLEHKVNLKLPCGTFCIKNRTLDARGGLASRRVGLDTIALTQACKVLAEKASEVRSSSY